MTVLSLPIHMGDGQTGDNRAFAEGWAKRGSPRAPSAPSLVPRAPSLVPRALNAPVPPVSCPQPRDCVPANRKCSVLGPRDVSKAQRSLTVTTRAQQAAWLSVSTLFVLRDGRVCPLPLRDHK